MSEPREPTPPPPSAPSTPPPRRRRRRHGRVRRWVIRPFVWGLLVLIALLSAGLYFIQTQYARQKALDRIVAQMNRFLGRQITIGSVDYTFFPLGIELRDVTIPGPRKSDPPVAFAPFVSIQMKVQDFEGRVFDLEQIYIDHPRLYLQLNPDGTSNLPQFHFGPRGGPRRFDVRIGRIVVDQGQVRINERRLPFQLDAKAVSGRAIGRAERGGEGGNRLDLLATAQEVVTTLPRAKPYPFTLSAKGSLLPDQGRIDITNTRMAGPDLQAQATGFVNYRAENRRVELNIKGDGAAQLVNRLGYAEQPIEGPATAQVRFTWTPDGWNYSGTAASPRIAALDRVIEDIDASFRGDRDGIDVDVRRARHAGGTIEGLVSVDTAHEGPSVPISLDLDYADLSIHQLIEDQFPGEDLPIVGGLSGRARGTLEYRFNSDAVMAGTGRANVHVRGTGETGLPIEGDLPIDLNRGVISGRNLHLVAPGQDITSPGFTYDLARGSGRFDFRLVSRDVGPLGPVLLGPPKRGEEPAFWLPTRGRGVAEGSITFVRKDYDLRLALDLQDVTAPITTADTVHGSLALNPRALENLRLEMTRAGGALLVTGRVPLPPEGRKVASQPLTLAVDAAQWPAAGLAYILGPELAGKFEGSLSGRVDLAGFPDRLNGQVDARVDNLVAYGVPLGRARADLAFNAGHITVEQAQVATPAGTVFAQGSFDQPTGGLSLTVLAPSLSLAAEPLRRYLGGELTGRVSLEAAANGSLRQPQATVSIRGEDLVLRGRPLGAQGETSALATWDGQRLDLRGSLLGLASFQGGGRLDRQGADLSLDVRSDNLGVLARVFSPQPLPDFSGSLLGTTTLAADFNAGSWRAAARLADLRLQYGAHAIANREPVVIAMDPRRVVIESLYMAEPDTENELIVSGAIGLAPEVPLDLRFQSTLSASWAGLVLPPEYRIEGAVDLLGAVRGTLGDPSITGEGEIRGGRMIVPTFAQSIEDVDGFLYFNRDRIVVDIPRARLGNTGTVRATGTLVLPGPDRQLGYNFTAQARDVSVRFPQFLNNRGNATVSLISSDGGRRIEGEIDLERSLYVEDLPVDLIQLIQNLFQRQRLEIAETDDFQATTQLNLAIRGADALRVRNNVADLQGDVDLVVRGTLARPVVFGEVEIDPGGTLIYNDNRYEVQRGELAFSNPNQINPVIDLVAQTEVQGFNITLNLGGTFEQPRIRFASDANLADLEIVSLIAGGQRPTEGLAPPPTPGEEDVAPNVLARQLLYGQAASAISQRVGNIFRFDRFRIDPVVEAGQPVSGIGITVGKRLSRDVFVTYSTEPTSNRQYIVQVEWQLRKNLTLVLTQAGDGTYAVDAQWQRRF